MGACKLGTYIMMVIVDKFKMEVSKNVQRNQKKRQADR